MISERGMSKLLIRKSKPEAINGLIYLEECLLKEGRLPFVNQRHQDSNYIFQLDLGDAHDSPG